VSAPSQSRGPGSRLGPYEILGRIGAGGMGEVYRARDSRLSREVALKVLSEPFALDRRRLQRFEQEARVVSALNHPNIVTVFEIGQADAVPFIAMEKIEGQSLRLLLRSGGLPLRKLLDLAIQIAEGIARAHEAGVVHRDLKPDNIMVTSDGVVKILDFGLAKLTRSFLERGAQPEDGTLPLPTEPGVLVGTVRYMAPEQASGQAADFRSDQFSLGSVMYEMATGEAAFQKETTVDTLSAILHDEPRPIAQVNPKLPAPMRWIIERCLAKDPTERYASTEDLARELRSLLEHLSDLSETGSEPPSEPSALRPRGLRWGRAVAAVVMAAALLLLELWVGRSTQPKPPRFRQLTAQGGAITTARFTPDGQTVVYSSQWQGKRPMLFETRLERAEGRPVALPSAQILSISRSGFMAIALLPPWGLTLRSPGNGLVDRFPVFLFGTLARVPLTGGTPREILETVLDADWAPNGRDLAITRFVDGKNRLEYPIGRTLFEHYGWLAFPRVSPDGEQVAFSDMGTNLRLVDRSGHVKEMGLSVWEHAWSPVTSEILWFDSSGGSSRLRAVSPSGKSRLLITLPGSYTIYDVSSSGTVLIGQITGNDEVYGSFPGEPRDRRLYSDAVLEDVSADGELVAISCGTIGEDPTACLGTKDGSPPKRLGALGGYAGARLSPDGKFVAGESSPDGLAVMNSGKSGIVLVPTGAGQSISISTRGLANAKAQGFSRDGKTIFLSGAEDGHGYRLWTQDLSGGQRRAVSPEGLRYPSLSPDGRYAVGFDNEGWKLFPTEPGSLSTKVAGILPGEQPIQWSADGRFLYVRGADELRPGDAFISARVYRLDPWTGHRELWKEIAPVAPSTGGGIDRIRFSSDGKTCFYTHHRFSAELFALDGVK